MSVIVLAGRRIDAPGAPARFPLDRVDAVRDRLRELFAHRGATHLVCSAACGADLVALEVARSLNLRTHIVLPVPPTRFRETSVVDRPGDWGATFDAALDYARGHGEVLVLGSREDDEAYAAVNEALFETSARLDSGHVDAVVVYEGRSRGEGDLTEHFAERALARGLDLRVVRSLAWELNEAYDRTCFVIMPFGRKAVGATEVDFDAVYHEVFEPAISAAALPEGGTLTPKRADHGFFSRIIDVEMFSLIEYARVALADVTGLNANVFYELGVRHHAQASGTVILRQAEVPLPFDISRIGAFPYDPQPSALNATRALVTQALNESLTSNRLDSPVRAALAAQRTGGEAFQTLLFEAQIALRERNPGRARDRYVQAVAVQPRNAQLRHELGLIYKELGQWDEAIHHFEQAVRLREDHADALRELGVALNKRYKPGRLTGESELRRALVFSPNDSDTWASLGGLLTRAGRFEEALKCYEKATHASRGNSYPLLNTIKLRAKVHGVFDVKDELFDLERAEQDLRAQVGARPVENAPWSYFDLAEVRLYLGDETEFLDLVRQGARACRASWLPATFRDRLNFLREGGVFESSVQQAQQTLERAISNLKKYEEEAL